MKPFVTATYHAKAKAAEYIDTDGSHFIRTGGSLQWRLNNCGNLMPPLTNGLPDPKKPKNYIGFATAGEAGHYFFIFPDYETGRAEVRASLLRKYKNMTLEQTITAYAPPHENDTAKYIADLCKLSGISKTEVIKDLGEERLNKMIDGMQRLEGYHANTETRKETPVEVTHIQATNGTRPVANEEIVVKNGGKETTLKSNAAGRFPPIVHGTAPIEVHHKTADGNQKKVAQLAPEKGGIMNLLTRAAEYAGITAPKAPPTKPIAAKQPVQYPVKSGDNLGKLAVRFQTTVAKIKQDNNLKSDKIMAGQVLSIHTPALTELKPAAPQQALRKIVPPKASEPASAPAKPPAPPPKPAASAPPAPKAKPVPPPEAQTAPARSKDGAGEALALIKPDEGVAPWMPYALKEAERWRGAEEDVIQRTRNYHTSIKTGQSSMVGTSHAWCAAFVNWNLLQAGYPIENLDATAFADRTADKGRANGMIQVHGPKEFPKQKGYEAPLVDNPLFYIIKEPVYGAIVVVCRPGGYGHHTGFVYAKGRDNFMIVLGGNQGQTVKFTEYNILPVAGTGKKKKVGARPDHLVFLLPASYKNPDQNGPDKLKTENVDRLNLAIGITPANAPSQEPESIR